MNITATDKPVEDQLVDFVVFPYFENTKQLTGSAKNIDDLLNQSISKLITDGEISGKVSETTILYTYGTIKPKKILIIGLGTLENCDMETTRTIFGKLSSNLKVKETNSALICLDSETISISPNTISKNPFVQAAVEGLILGSYQFTKHKSNATDNEIDIFLNFEKDEIAEVNEAISIGNIVSNAVNLCRDLANEPSNILTPTKLSDTAKKLSLDSKIEYKSLDKDEMGKLGMGALLGV
ncbi:uncharacterized protein METZ01_LOCUS289989, partial [marine metagenome]